VPFAGRGLRQYGRMGSMQIITSSLSLARQLWRYGEPELADRALLLTPTEVADIGARAGVLFAAQADGLWPHGPGDRALMLAATEHLEGLARPCQRVRRLPEKSLPANLQASQDQRWAAALPVAAVVDARHAGRPSHP
jgi:hypothetical protein